jgi:hypothetical protein
MQIRLIEDYCRWVGGVLNQEGIFKEIQPSTNFADDTFFDLTGLRIPLPDLLALHGRYMPTVFSR